MHRVIATSLQIAIIASLLAVLCAATPALAQIKVGFVDRERILRDSGAAKRAQAKLKKEFATREAELEKLEKQGRELQTMLQKESVTLPEAERSARERQLAQLDRDFKRMQRELREDQTLRSNEELVSLQERANKIITEMAEKEKFDLIVQEAVYASAKIDITEK
ncbi:MAG: OmpH family outer membrane protein [Gammaproteobacteria bacterium]|nr:OmpH family outer membrane protein [Gammaproteobacteria bacterium]